MAPLITAPLRSHATLVDVGVFRNPPVVQLSVEPTVGVPVIDGLPTGTGAWMLAAAATTRTCRSDVETLPALSTACAVSVTVRPDGRGRRRVAELERIHRHLATCTPLASRLTCFMSPRSSNAVTSSSTGSAGVAW